MDKKITMMLAEIMDAITSNKFKKTVFNAVAPEDENIFVFFYPGAEEENGQFITL